MKYEDFVKAFKPILDYDKEFDSANQAVQMLCRNSFPVFDIGAPLQSSYVELLSKYCGDTDSFISWYIYENDYGKKREEVGYTDTRTGEYTTRKVCNLHDLWEIISYGEALC